ncbi:MAG: hypothetical protein GY898_05505 [Proteobacteria bacterium]|nr:hypothetical protein [Pseudomonadota bacterium]
MIRALLGCVALAAMLTALPAVAHADSVPYPDRAQWDREDNDPTHQAGWRKQSHRMLETHMRAWAWGGQIAPLLTGATLLGLGGGLEAANGTGYVLLYFALPMGLASWAMSLGIWPTFAVAFDIVNSNSNLRYAIARFRKQQAVNAWTALGLGLLATLLTALAPATAGVTAFLGGMAFAPIPFLGHASVAYGVFAKQLEARHGDDGTYHRFRGASVTVGLGSFVVRF